MNLKSFIYSYQLRLRQRLAARSCANLPNRTIDPASFAPANVLFVLAGLIGDSVMSLSAIETARRLWPKAVITVLGKKHNRELIAACDFFDEFYEFNADPFSLRRSDETRKLESWLAGQDFDAAIILLGDQFAHLLARAGIPVRVGTKGSPLESCLTHAYDIGSPRTWGADEKLNSLRCLGYPVQFSVPKLRADAEVKGRVAGILASLGLHRGEDYVVFHPFGSTHRQWWKPEESAAIAKIVWERYGLKVVLIGGPEAKDAASSSHCEELIDTVGRFSLSELLLVIEGSRLVLTTDSGPFHIAGGLGKPIVGLFRSRRPEHAGTYSKTEVLLGEAVGCETRCDWERCQDNPCRQMRSIGTSEIYAALDTLLR